MLMSRRMRDRIVHVQTNRSAAVSATIQPVLQQQQHSAPQAFCVMPPKRVAVAKPAATKAKKKQAAASRSTLSAANLKRKNDIELTQESSEHESERASDEGAQSKKRGRPPGLHCDVCGLTPEDRREGWGGADRTDTRNGTSTTRLLMPNQNK